ncbi:MAG: AAA family ATPase [Spirochaetia bacterium]|nr:AAA family ATPase [Spirochaetia bacterium]
MEKNEKVRIIIENIQRKRNEVLRFYSLFETIVKPNKVLFSQWINQVNPNSFNLDDCLLRIEKDLLLIDQIVKKYETLLNKINSPNDLSETYLQLIYDSFSRQDKIFQFSNWVPHIQNTFQIVKLDDYKINEKNSIVSFLHTLIQNSFGFSNEELSRLSQIEAFHFFANSTINYVLVGANGSGKSSFARQTRQILGRNVAIISAQKVFYLSRVTNVTLGKSSRSNVWSFQNQDKLYKNEGFSNKIEQDLNNVFKSLVEEDNECKGKFYDSYDNKNPTQKPTTTLQKVIEIWNKLLIHRKLSYSEGYLTVIPESGDSYDFMYLSDGEKAIFYYIAHVLIAQEKSYIIVDEPENHLHLALVAKLWDTLELVREDCQFIYLTHNLEFANTRTNSKKIWMKSFTSPATWDMQEIESNDDIPQVLYMELLGSRKAILFCEGKKTSYDINLYSRLFPNYLVIPVDGHMQVINFTRAFNASTSIHGNHAIGIIDGDFHTEAQKSKWESEHIYCVEAQEVENILCDDILLQCAKEQFMCSEDVYEQAKGRLFSDLEREIEKQAIEYATQRINERLESNLLKKEPTQESLKNSLSNLLALDGLNVDTLILERKELIQKIIDDRDYDLGIRTFNYKGLIGRIPVMIEKDYPKKVFVMIDKHPDVLEKLRIKYFPKVPIGEVNDF